jgi:hypothetical protein
VPSPGRPMTFQDRGQTRVGLVSVGSEHDRPRWLDAIVRPSLATVFWSPTGARSRRSLRARRAPRGGRPPRRPVERRVAADHSGDLARQALSVARFAASPRAGRGRS